MIRIHAQGQARTTLTDALDLLVRSSFIEDRAPASVLPRIRKPLKKKIQAGALG